MYESKEFYLGILNLFANGSKVEEPKAKTPNIQEKAITTEADLFGAYGIEFSDSDLAV